MNNCVGSNEKLLDRSDINQRNNRIYLWDNLKFFLILLVVLGHFVEKYDFDPKFQSIFLFIYSFHMPLFIMISGFFHRNTRIVEKVVTYLFIYVLFKLMLMIEYYILWHKNIGINLFTEKGTPWYMLAMATYISIAYLLRNIDLKVLLMMTIILSCASGYDGTIGDYLALSRFFSFFPFYILGQLCATKNGIIGALRRKYSRFAAFAIIILWMLICYCKIADIYILRHLFTGRNPFKPELGIWGGLYRLGTIALSALLCFAFILVCPTKPIIVITKNGSKTLQVYFWHKFVMYILDFYNVSSKLWEYGVYGKLLWLFTGVIVTLLLTLRIFEFPVSTIQKCILRTGQIPQKVVE